MLVGRTGGNVWWVKRGGMRKAGGVAEAWTSGSTRRLRRRAARAQVGGEVGPTTLRRSGASAIASGGGGDDVVGNATASADAEWPRRSRVGTAGNRRV